MGLIGLQCKVVPEILVASRKISIEENITINIKLNTAYDELYNYVMANHTCVDYCKAMLCNKNNTKLEYQYVEAVLFLRAALQETDLIKIYKLPQIYAVSVVHIGEFSTIENTHIELTKWIKDNKYTINGPYRELYYKHDLRNINDTITEKEELIIVSKVTRDLEFRGYLL